MHKYKNETPPSEGIFAIDWVGLFLLFLPCLLLQRAYRFQQCHKFGLCIIIAMYIFKSGNRFHRFWGRVQFVKCIFE